MKKLLLLRHAHAGPNAVGESDHERPLSARGRHAAASVSETFAQRGDAPSLALCSTARRALETLEPLRQRLAIGVETDRALYLADAEQILTRVAAVGNRAEAVLVVGHNPGLHQCALQLAAEGDDTAQAQLRTGLPPAALAIFEVAVAQWAEIRPGCGTLVELRVARESA